MITPFSRSITPPAQTGLLPRNCFISEPPYPGRPKLHDLLDAHREAPVPDPLSIDPELPAECATIIRMAMAKDPAQRYQNAMQMRQDLEWLNELGKRET